MNPGFPPLLARARALTGYPALVATLGGDANALLSSVGIDPQRLTQPEATIGLPQVVELLEMTAQKLAVDDFGLRLAAAQDLSVLGPIALVARQATDIRGALQAIARNLPYHVARSSIRLEDEIQPGWSCLYYELPIPPDKPQRHAVELCCLMAMRAIQMLSGSSGADWQVQLIHHEGLSSARYRSHFGCAVHLGQPCNAMHFPSHLLDMPIDSGSRQLGDFAQRFIDQVIRRNPLDLPQQIEELLTRQLVNEPCTLPQIAGQLAIHERTLQRRLEGHQIRFAEIADRVRRNRAREYLQHTDIPASQIAPLIGYSDLRSFSHACQRWFGCTPARLRKQLQQSGTSASPVP